MNTENSTQTETQLSDEENEGLFGQLIVYIPSVLGVLSALWRYYVNFLKPKSVSINSISKNIDQQTDATLTEIFNYHERFLYFKLQMEETLSNYPDMTNSEESFKNIIYLTKREIIDYHERFLDFREEMQETLSKYPDMTNVEESLQNMIDQTKQEMTDNFIKDSIKSSLALIALHSVKLYIVHQEISQAEKLHEIARQVSNPNRNITKSLINKSIGRLNLYAKMQLLDGTINFVTAVGTMIQLQNVRESMSTNVSGMGYLIVSGFFIITGFNVWRFFCIKEKLNQLREDLRHL